MLTFKALRSINVTRCVAGLKHPLNLWSVAEWGNATAGECGEACNVAKKMLREKQGLLNTDGLTMTDYKQKLADELADTVIYIDLWAASEGIDLEVAIRQKFNADSEKRKLNYIIPV